MRVWALRQRRALLTAVCLCIGSLAHADVDVEIRGVNDELRSNVLVYLSLARYKGRELDADTVERLHNRVEREVKEALGPFGYYGPSVESQITERGKGDWRAVIQIDPGTPVMMTSVGVRVSGPGATDRVFQRVLERVQLKSGDQLRHAAYQQLKDELQRTAATYGYLDARLTHNELRVDPATHSATPDLELETGERYRFGAT